MAWLKNFYQCRIYNHTNIDESDMFHHIKATDEKGDTCLVLNKNKRKEWKWVLQQNNHKYYNFYLVQKQNYPLKARKFTFKNKKI